MKAYEEQWAGTWGGRSRTRDWNREARVRSGESATPWRASDPGDLFAVELLPHVSHPTVSALGSDARRELCRRALVRYLHSVSVLEIRVVNVVAAEIAHGFLGEALSGDVRRAALQLTCDEGYHAVLAADLLEHVAPQHTPSAPIFFERLNDFLDEQARDAHDALFLKFLFTVVTETSITANMRVLARGNDVTPAVRSFVADHARDEAWHGSFFSALFRTHWARLSESERTRYGALLPTLIDVYLRADTGAILADLRAVGIGRGASEEVWCESFGSAHLRETNKAASAPVLACFRRAGALVGETHEAFVAAGLVERAA
ncbi:MAG: diiron oxygenase [Polyangiaceae bacterium]|nr:diiron oxygenase [Polyangiaceae bacterium]